MLALGQPLYVHPTPKEAVTSDVIIPFPSIINSPTVHNFHTLSDTLFWI